MQTTVHDIRNTAALYAASISAAGVLASAMLRQSELEDGFATHDGSRIVAAALGMQVQLFIRTDTRGATLKVRAGEKQSTRSAPVGVTLALELESDLIERLEAAIDTSEGADFDLGQLPGSDPIHALASALLSASETQTSVKDLYAQSLGLMIAARVLSDQGRASLASRGRSVCPLPKWRLRRVVDYVDAKLGGTITLANLAGEAGLTPMYFAAQFRAAMGMRPHDYVLQRRIELAQQRLATTSDRLVEIALDVGFQTQAHFTTVFKRFSGTTPHRWREIALGHREAA